MLDKLRDKSQEIIGDNEDAQVYLTRDTHEIVGRLRDLADEICCDNDVCDYILNDDIIEPSEHNTIIN